MQLGEVANPEATEFGKPLEGIRVLAVEQMQAMPFATQLFARLGADVIKIEDPVRGESGRGSTPFMVDPEGRHMGATFVRNNLSKRSVGVDVRNPKGRDLVIRLAKRMDIFAENYKAGAMDECGLGYQDLSAVNPRLIYASVSGFGLGESPYRGRPAYAPIVESMSGAYEYQRDIERPPTVAPVGALGDISTGMFATIGMLAALIHRERTGLGQHVDVAMLDSMVAMSDVVTNFWSMGVRPDIGGSLAARIIMHAFRASDGYFVIQVGREHQFERLAKTTGHPEWINDPRLATREDWHEHIDDIIRPAIESWARTLTRDEACMQLNSGGVVAGPCATPPEVIADPHVRARNMLVELDPGDGGSAVVVPGNPVKMSRVAEGPDSRLPWLNEHTDEVLVAELGLDQGELDAFRLEGVIG
jgi:crotonobetainyl-CoA:carnitine CoA-transferase CaiB-like acyl-CoA transferase